MNPTTAFQRIQSETLTEERKLSGSSIPEGSPLVDLVTRCVSEVPLRSLAYAFGL